MADVRALTLWQPWASLIALLVKHIETRSWATAYRGTVLIHAAVRPPETMRLGDWWCEPTWGNEFGLLNEAGQPHRLPLSAVVAVVELVDVVPIVERWAGRDNPEALAAVAEVPKFVTVEPDVLMLCDREATPVWQRIDDQRPFGDFTAGRFAHLYESIRPLSEPVPAKGFQGLWKPSDALGAEVMERVG